MLVSLPTSQLHCVPLPHVNLPPALGTEGLFTEAQMKPRTCRVEHPVLALGTVAGGGPWVVVAATAARRVVRYNLPPDAAGWGGSKAVRSDGLLAVPDKPLCTFATTECAPGLLGVCTGDGVLHVGPAAAPPESQVKVADSFGVAPAAIAFDLRCHTCVVGSADGCMAFYKVAEQLRGVGG